MSCLHFFVLGLVPATCGTHHELASQDAFALCQSREWAFFHVFYLSVVLAPGRWDIPVLRRAASHRHRAICLHLLSVYWIFPMMQLSGAILLLNHFSSERVFNASKFTNAGHIRIPDASPGLNRHDVYAILAAMTPDPYRASLGPDVKGTVYVGQAQSALDLRRRLRQFPDASEYPTIHCGNRFSLSGFPGTRSTGSIENVCAYSHFPRGKIRGRTRPQAFAPLSNNSHLSARPFAHECASRDHHNRWNIAKRRKS